MSDLFQDTLPDNDDIARAVEAIANPLEHLVGDGKKFKTQEDLARGKLYSDMYVPKLELENKAYKEKLALIEAELEETRSRAMETVNMVNSADTTGLNDKPNDTNPIKHEDIDKLINERLASAKDTERRAHNVETVRTELTKNLGEKFDEHMQTLANEYGKDYLAKMAEENPKAFIRLAMSNTPTTVETPRTNTNLFSPPTNTLNTQARAQVTAPVKGHKYYHEMRRTDPKRFNSPQIYAERLEAFATLGDAYFKN